MPEIGATGFSNKCQNRCHTIFRFEAFTAVKTIAESSIESTSIKRSWKKLSSRCSELGNKAESSVFHKRMDKEKIRHAEWTDPMPILEFKTYEDGREPAVVAYYNSETEVLPFGCDAFDDLKMSLRALNVFSVGKKKPKKVRMMLIKFDGKLFAKVDS